MDAPPSSETWPWISEVEIHLKGRDQEQLVIAYLDRRDSIVDMRVEAGRETSLDLPLRAILRDILEKEPAAVLLAHNHPSGSPLPSVADKRATRMLCAVLRPMGVHLADHWIYAGDLRISMREMGLL